MNKSLLARFVPVQGTRVSIALLLLRIVVGASFLSHGAPKLAHPMSWADHFPIMPGIPPILQLCVVVAENAGGVAIILGLLTPLFALMQACDMSVVILGIAVAHGWPYTGNGARNWETEAHLLIASVVLVLCGPGRYSIDAVIAALSDRRLATHPLPT